jgi:hypothetical protein
LVLELERYCTFVFPSVGSNVHVPVPTMSPAYSISIDLASTICHLERRFGTCSFGEMKNHVANCTLTVDWHIPFQLVFKIWHPPMCDPCVLVQNSLVDYIGGASMTVSSRRSIFGITVNRSFLLKAFFSS